jgi:hypothetical protein
VKLTRAALLLGLFILIVFAFRIRPASAVSQQSRPAPSPIDSREDTCHNALLEIRQKDGIWETYSVDENFGTVIVGGSFRKSALKEKETVNRLMRCVLTNGKGDESVSSIEYVDSTTHKPVALWSPYAGLELE